MAPPSGSLAARWPMGDPARRGRGPGRAVRQSAPSCSTVPLLLVVACPLHGWAVVSETLLIKDSKSGLLWYGQLQFAERGASPAWTLHAGAGAGAGTGASADRSWVVEAAVACRAPSSAAATPCAQLAPQQRRPPFTCKAEQWTDSSCSRGSACGDGASRTRPNSGVA